MALTLRKQKSRKDQVAELASDYLKLEAVGKAAKGAHEGGQGHGRLQGRREDAEGEEDPGLRRCRPRRARRRQGRARPRRRARHRLTRVLLAPAVPSGAAGRELYGRRRICASAARPRARRGRAERPHAAELRDLGRRAEAVRLGQQARLEHRLPRPARAAARGGRDASSRPPRARCRGTAARRRRRRRSRAASCRRRSPHGRPAAAPARRRRGPTASRAGSRGPGDGAGEPSELVMPHSNQHIAPAERPASTTPASQHSRRITSRPSARQTASSPSIEPPPT